ncbi:hypothetical protein U8D42_18215 [Mycobacterium europaeum]|uniref:hypothetical protein n=1 Tax=Mycobacterium europaeum TaxID=761804 RepID=UPI002AE0714D|nr:hypothetical protein [Mycobacterium europaeum]MEA1158712.1 hypothetical protein [Mycobacterium europaeum]
MAVEPDDLSPRGAARSETLSGKKGEALAVIQPDRPTAEVHLDEDFPAFGTLPAGQDKDDDRD